MLEIVNSNAYEEMAATYQCIEIARLNEVLRDNGITDLQVRRAICEQYFFHSGVFLDSGWFKSQGAQVFPELCFAERPHGPDVHMGEITTLHVQSDYFAFHEYADGDAYWYFDEHSEDASEVEQGTV